MPALLGATGLSALLVLVLWVSVATQPPDQFDRRVYGWIHGSPGTTETGLAKHLTTIGDGLPLIAVLVTLSCVARFVLKRWAPLIITAIAVTGAAATSTLVKLAAGRARPPRAGWMSDAGGNSFPSGHTTATTAGYLGLAFAVAVLVEYTAARVLVLAAGAALPLAIGWTRIELGVHWPTDVMAGWAVGTGAACAALACWLLAPPTLRP